MGLREFAIIACIFSSCGKTPEHVKKCDQVGREFAQQMEREEGFAFLGTGGIYGKSTIDQIYVDFEVNREVSSDEAKILIEKTAQKFVKYIEERVGFTKYLSHAPFSLKEISISIGFVDTNRVPREEIAEIALYDGNITLSSYKKSTKEYILQTKEPAPFCNAP